ncbi:MAG: hypothetical protein D6757_03790 [Alphaproteobacteria bacterium]|nr:MAG: hypothetical protein D6757_03790 [Alphaproteobacteria bacterium]
MGRLVTPSAPPQVQTMTAVAEPPDTYIDRIAKYVPAEIIGAYLAVEKMMATGPDDRTLAFATLAAFTVLTPLYFHSLPGPAACKRLHMLISTLAFLLWSYALPGAAWVSLGLDDPRLAGVLLIVGSLAFGLIKPPPADDTNGEGKVEAIEPPRTGE